MAEIVQHPGVGCVVEFMEGNTAQIAWVMEESGGKLRLLLPNRREMNLNANRLLPWSGPFFTMSCTKEEAAQELQQCKARREALTQAVDPLAVWELAQGELEQASAQWFAELFHSEPDIHTIVAFGHALLGCKTHFKFHPPEFEIYSAEYVQNRLVEQEAVRKREALMHQGGDFIRLLWEIVLGKAKLPAMDSQNPPEAVAEQLRGIILNKIADPDKSTDELWKALCKGLPEDPHLALHLATAWGLVPPHHNFWLDRADYATSPDWADRFADSIAVQAAQVEQAMPQLAECALPFVSIDSVTTKDIDDAFYIERTPQGWTVSLVLAAPALHWPFESPFDKVVLHRATSIYLPEASWHMLPECMGINSFSLHSLQRKPALLLRCTLSEQGEILDCEPQCVSAMLAANLSYIDCEAVLTSAAENAASPYATQLVLASELAEKRKALRIEQGAVIITRPDLKISLENPSENPQPMTVQAGIVAKDVLVRLEEESPQPAAQLLVAELMILANAAVAQWAIAHQVPLIFRTQDVAVPKEYAGEWIKAHEISQVVKILAASLMESRPKKHAAIAVDAYATITSPLRRYPDLFNEAQIFSWLETGQARFSLEELDALLPTLNACLDASGQVQRFRPRYWKLLYFRQQGDKVWWDAVVTDENDNFVTVTLEKEQLLVRAKRHLFGEKIWLGQALQVRIGKVNPLYNEFSLMEVRDVE